ncbi:addiction module antidote protein [uncultured Brevundimonas sp.]|uniref:addiction module antidote protein n=1 Tax=uncultured Brevundimonas sp. TaxID=213418 RepID=UPI002603B59A|nr:addiction module antidote protein [uncultured Brevundimonas sp.]
MSDIATKAFDVSEHLRTPEDIADYLQAALDDGEGDTRLFRAALADALKAHNRISGAAASAGISRQGAYKALSAEGNPSFDTILKLMKAAGLSFEIKAAA